MYEAAFSELNRWGLNNCAHKKLAYRHYGSSTSYSSGKRVTIGDHGCGRKGSQLGAHISLRFNGCWKGLPAYLGKGTFRPLKTGRKKFLLTLPLRGALWPIPPNNHLLTPKEILKFFTAMAQFLIKTQKKQKKILAFGQFYSPLVVFMHFQTCINCIAMLALITNGKVFLVIIFSLILFGMFRFPDQIQTYYMVKVGYFDNWGYLFSWSLCWLTNLTTDQSRHPIALTSIPGRFTFVTNITTKTSSASLYCSREVTGFIKDPSRKVGILEWAFWKFYYYKVARIK